MNDSWDRPTVDFIDTRQLAWHPFHAVHASALGGAGGEGTYRNLGGIAKNGAHTSLIRFRAQQKGVLTTNADILVLSGSGRFGKEDNYKPGDYVRVRQGSSLAFVPTSGETILYAAFDGANQLESMPQGIPYAFNGNLLRASDRQWTVMSWRGERADADGPGARIQWLRQVDEGDEGMVFLAAMLPGWSCSSLECHPVYEESFKLAGDLMMGSLGVVPTGGYFFRAPDVWHGPLYSRGGSFSIIRKNALGSTDYKDPPAGGSLEQLIAYNYGSATEFVDVSKL